MIKKTEKQKRKRKAEIGKEIFLLFYFPSLNQSKKSEYIYISNTLILGS